MSALPRICIVKRSIPTIVVEKRALFREGVTSLLNNTRYKVLASLASVSEIPHLRLSPGRPILAMLGLSGGLDETLQMVQCVRRKFPGCKILALGEHFGALELKDILNSGVDAIVFNVGSSEALLKVIDLAFLGQQLIISGQPVDSGPKPEGDSTRATTKSEIKTGSKKKNFNGVSPPDPHFHLSEREQQVLLCVARGESNKTIARSCSITEATVKVHLQSILRKISVQNRTQAALWAVENGLLPNQNAFGSNGGNGLAALSEDGASMGAQSVALPDPG
jgi:two-component system, NarL family, nitrate/nitrite response regulator NarL